MHHSGPIDADVVFVVESKELLPDELHAVVHDNGVWYSKAMDDVEEEQQGLLGLCKLVYGDKQVGIAPERFFERSDQIEPLDC